MRIDKWCAAGIREISGVFQRCAEEKPGSESRKTAEETPITARDFTMAEQTLERSWVGEVKC